MIKEANPHVDLEKLEPGTVITVPEGLPGVKVEPSRRLPACGSGRARRRAAQSRQGRATRSRRPRGASRGNYAFAKASTCSTPWPR